MPRKVVEGNDYCLMREEQFVGVRVVHFFSFLGCPIMCFMFLVPCCAIHYDFRIKTMFDSSLLPVVCRRVHVLLTLFVFVCA
jgi:uncharacterized membrane protein YesL